MKKISLLLGLVLILMTACTPAQPQDSQTSGDNACHQILVLDSLKAYEAYLSTQRLPRDFVHLDNMPNFGSFKYLIPTLEFPNEYHYSFRDLDGRQIDLYVTHNAKTNAKTEQYPELSVTSDMTSMNKVPHKGRSVIKRNGIEYRYGQSGYIMYIVWYDNNTEFKLSGHLTISTNSLVKRLLSISETEAAAAFAEIKQSLSAGK